MTEQKLPPGAGGLEAPKRKHAIARLLNKLILASGSKGYQQNRQIADDDRITDADIDRIEQQILSIVDELLAALPSAGGWPLSDSDVKMIISALQQDDDVDLHAYNRIVNALLPPAPATETPTQE